VFLKLLKNVLCSALLIAGVTVASVTVAFVLALLTAPPPPDGVSAPPMALAVLFVFALAVLAGLLFSVGTLFAALLTMPLTLWMARALRLPRPLVDVIGGAAVAALCVSLALAEMSTGKLADLVQADTAHLFKLIGVLGGAFAGYVRHAWLVRPRQVREAAPLPQVGGLARG
jgi:hypothetical protein